MSPTTQKLLYWGSICTLVLNLMVLALFAVIVFSLTGRIEKELADLSVPVTAFTRFFLAVPKSMLFVPSVVIAGVVMIAKEKLIKSVLTNFILNKVIFIGLILLLVAYIVAVLMPLYSTATTL
ncbi:MAG: hypothetical protein CMJ19_02370 [Phycisphaeraceae bacterium]|nr:hypothetical protein [Phycisphaeraceae bacterium]